MIAACQKNPYTTALLTLVFSLVLSMTFALRARAKTSKNKISTHYLKYETESVRLDIYNPHRDNCPVVILIHGSAGISGDRATRYKNFATDLMYKGIIAINVHYFESQQHNWLKTFFHTLDYVHTIPNADTSKICLVGYSLGGTLAIKVASMDDRINLLVISSGYLPEHFRKQNAASLPKTYIIAGTKDKAIDTLYQLKSWLTELGIPIKTKINYGYGHTIPIKLFRQNWQSIVSYITEQFGLSPWQEKSGIKIRM